MDYDECGHHHDPTKRALLQITVEQAALADEVCTILMAMTCPNVVTSSRPTRKTFAS